MMNSPSAKGYRILVVEDEPVISRVCVGTLRGEGFEVDVADNGAIAEVRLGENEYDLVIIDIRTPIMNGKQLYQYMVENYPGLVEGVIFTTGDLLGGDIKSFLEQSGRLFLPKPFTPDGLRNIVKKALGR